FLFTVLRRPRSPLVPYTTLFRSAVGGPLFQADAVDAVQILQAGGAAAGDGAQGGVVEDDVGGQVVLARDLGAPGLQGLEAFALGDRKSTRLNSSHVKISYAVFCL